MVTTCSVKSKAPIDRFYHVTRETNYPAIEKGGLAPRIGDVSRLLTRASQRPRIYFWTSLDDAIWFKRAAKQFFEQADIMEPTEDLVILSIDAAELKRRGIKVMKRCVEYPNIGQTKLEGETTQPIPANIIKRVKE